MRKLFVYLAMMLMAQLSAAEMSLGVVPKPNRLVEGKGFFCFDAKTRWLVPHDSVIKSISKLRNDISITSGYQQGLKVGTRQAANTVLFVVNPMLAKEAYKLDITANSVRVEAAGCSGFYYATQTLRQLLPPQVNAGKTQRDLVLKVPCLSISDAPRFGYRGFMLDVSRYFMPKAELLRLLDYLAYHKINFFHWHLVDDNGWRIEIKKYPRLTDVGAWRVDRTNIFSLRNNPQPGEPTPSGGYYTQDDIREIVKYANDHFIEVIPEIEMPAHTNASLAAYPALACPVTKGYIGVLPGMGGKNANIIYCAGKDSVFSFLEDVLTEIMTLFPSKYIHVGGDEANKENWEKCPLCQSRMKENQITDESGLQSYFLNRINRFLRNKGKQLMGWDELVDDKLPDDAVIFGWRGMGLDAEKAGSRGAKYIKSPALKYYFIRYQGPQWFEPYTYFGNTTLKDVYDYEPLSQSLPDSVSRNMLGVESCLWTEFVTKPGESEYLIFPRLAAFSESAWSMPENKSWTDFSTRIDRVLSAYDNMEINYSRAMFNLDHTVRPLGKELAVTLSCIRPDVEIRYTTDGTEPRSNSLFYSNEFKVGIGTTIRAASFINGKRVGAVLSLNAVKSLSTAALVTAVDPHAYVLTNGLRGSEKITDGEWMDYYDCDGEFVIQFAEKKSFSSVHIGALNNAGMAVHLPMNVKVLVSDNGVNYLPVYEKSFSQAESFQQGLFKFDIVLNVGMQSGRHLKVEFKNPGKCPAGFLRENQKSRVAIDEILVF